VAGSYIYEPANSVHTLDVPEDNEGTTNVLFVIEGALLNLDADGGIESVTDGRPSSRPTWRCSKPRASPAPTDSS